MLTRYSVRLHSTRSPSFLAARFLGQLTTSATQSRTKHPSENLWITRNVETGKEGWLMRISTRLDMVTSITVSEKVVCYLHEYVSCLE